MRIQNPDGTAWFDLDVERYEFPELEHDELDSNWLVVRARMVTATRSWQFEDPCLLTTEAHGLACWLADLASRKPTRSRIHFIEPNLSFEVISSQSPTVELRLYFALESLPPGVDTEYDEFFVVLHVSRDQLGTAAHELLRTLDRFPVRAGLRKWTPPLQDT